MSLPSSANPIVQREKQPTNVYTVMLILSFLALLIGTISLSMELRLYGNFPWWRASASGPSTSTPVAPSAPVAPVAPAVPGAVAPAPVGGAAPVAPPAGAPATAPMPAAAS